MNIRSGVRPPATSVSVPAAICASDPGCRRSPPRAVFQAPPAQRNALSSLPYDLPQESNCLVAYRSRSRDQLHVMETHDAEPVAVLLAHDLLGLGRHVPDLLDRGGV